MQTKNKPPKFLSALMSIRIDATFLVLLTFILLQVFKLVDLLITNKTVENIFVIPFQLIIFIIPAFLFAKHKSPKDPTAYILKTRMKLPAVHMIPLMVSGLFVLASGCILISLAFGGESALSDGFTLYNTFVSRNSGGFFESLYLIIAYALVPAVCEELVFRGILCREFERYNVPIGIFASALFFSLLHFDLTQLPVFLFAGIFFALTMYATGSVLVPMIIHFCYNVVGLFGQGYLNAFYEITGSVSLFAFLVALIGLLSSALFCTFAAKCYLRRAPMSNIPDHKLFPPANKVAAVISEIFLSPWAIASVCFYIVVIIIYSVI